MAAAGWAAQLWPCARQRPNRRATLVAGEARRAAHPRPPSSPPPPLTLPQRHQPGAHHHQPFATHHICPCTPLDPTTASATNLGEYHHHKPTLHASAFKGANRFRFNADRSRITAIDGAAALAGGRAGPRQEACNQGQRRRCTLSFVRSPARTPRGADAACLPHVTRRTFLSPLSPPPPAVYRSAFAEDLDEVGERRMAQEGGFRELRLRRLA